MNSGLRPAATTMLDKIWAQHSILERADGQTLLYIDRHLIHDGYAPAFEFLQARQLRPRSPKQTFGTPDHYVPTDGRAVERIASAERRDMVRSLVENAGDYGITPVRTLRRPAGYRACDRPRTGHQPARA